MFCEISESEQEAKLELNEQNFFFFGGDNMRTEPVNRNSSDEVKRLMEFFGSIEGSHILTGQHTQTNPMEELSHIRSVTGKEPALLGFELLAYSPNIRDMKADPACEKEVIENRGTIERAFEWGLSGGIVTLTWHWFSPMYGTGKAFYAKNTEFDAERVLIRETAERKAFFSDLDSMEKLLLGFYDRRIPVLWRPFHESDGDWFWWGAKGPRVAKELYLLMFDYFSGKKELSNLIWVHNSRLPEGYVGDDCCDLISCDTYPGEHVITDFSDEYEGLKKLTKERKGVALAETGVYPDVEKLSENKIPWLYYMLWSKEFCLSEQYNYPDDLKRVFSSPYALKKSDLPNLSKA